MEQKKHCNQFHVLVAIDCCSWCSGSLFLSLHHNLSSHSVACLQNMFLFFCGPLQLRVSLCFNADCSNSKFLADVSELIFMVYLIMVPIAQALTC
jgi:hypothetical protein